MNLEKVYPKTGEDVYWQRDVKRVYIFSERTGESIAGNITAGRIIELSDGTRSGKEIGEVLMREFGEHPPEEEVLTFVSEFFSECEKKGFIELREAPAEKLHHEGKEYTFSDVEKLLEENALLIIDEKASFEPTDDGNLITYSVNHGTYLVLTEEEREILMVILEEKPLQEILCDVSKMHSGASQVLAEFVCELLNYGLAKVQ